MLVGVAADHVSAEPAPVAQAGLRLIKPHSLLRQVTRVAGVTVDEGPGAAEEPQSDSAAESDLEEAAGLVQQDSPLAEDAADAADGEISDSDESDLQEFQDAEVRVLASTSARQIHQPPTGGLDPWITADQGGCTRVKGTSCPASIAHWLNEQLHHHQS